jgi:hypothetical protein
MAACILWSSLSTLKRPQSRLRFLSGSELRTALHDDSNDRGAYPDAVARNDVRAIPHREHRADGVLGKPSGKDLAETRSGWLTPVNQQQPVEACFERYGRLTALQKAWLQSVPQTPWRTD